MYVHMHVFIFKYLYKNSICLKKKINIVCITKERQYKQKAYVLAQSNIGKLQQKLIMRNHKMLKQPWRNCAFFFGGGGQNYSFIIFVYSSAHNSGFISHGNFIGGSFRALLFTRVPHKQKTTTEIDGKCEPS